MDNIDLALPIFPNTTDISTVEADAKIWCVARRWIRWIQSIGCVVIEHSIKKRMKIFWGKCVLWILKNHSRQAETNPKLMSLGAMLCYIKLLITHILPPSVPKLMIPERPTTWLDLMHESDMFRQATLPISYTPSHCLKDIDRNTEEHKQVEQLRKSPINFWMKRLRIFLVRASTLLVGEMVGNGYARESMNTSTPLAGVRTCSIVKGRVMMLEMVTRTVLLVYSEYAITVWFTPTTIVLCSEADTLKAKYHNYMKREPDSEERMVWIQLIHEIQMGMGRLLHYLQRYPLQTNETPLLTVVNESLTPDALMNIQSYFNNWTLTRVYSSDDEKQPFRCLAVLATVHIRCKAQCGVNWLQEYFISPYKFYCHYLRCGFTLNGANVTIDSARPMVVFLKGSWVVSCNQCLQYCESVYHALTVWAKWLRTKYNSVTKKGQSLHAVIEWILDKV